MMGLSPQCYIKFPGIGPLGPEKIFEGFLPHTETKLQVATSNSFFLSANEIKMNFCQNLCIFNRLKFSGALEQF